MPSTEVKRRKRALIAASIVGLLALGANLGLSQNIAHAAEGEDAVHCYGVNTCKGTGECGGKGHSCAGKNTCKGQGWHSLAEEECLSMEGGRLTPEKEEG